MWDVIKEFNKDYASAISAITPFLLGIISWLYYRFYKEAKLNEGDAASIIKPIFWSLGKKYNIQAAHEYQKDDSAISGYKHMPQNSRPDQWQKLVSIKKSFLGLRFKVTLNEPEKILTVIISRNGKEKWRLIKFNQ